MPYRSASLVLLFVVATLRPDAAIAEEYKLYFLGGQSNMDGYGHVKTTSQAELVGEVEGVMIFHGNPAQGRRGAGRARMQWAPLQPGYGVGFRSDGTANQLSDRFGPELTFGQSSPQTRPTDKSRDHQILARRHVDRRRQRPTRRVSVAGSPPTRGGKGEGKGVNQYDHFLATVRNALAVRDIDGDGEEDRLVVAGIVWMQGESDAFTEPVANRYEDNLENVIDHIRRALVGKDTAKAAKLPVVIGRVADSVKEDGKRKMMAYGHVVQEAQAEFVKKDNNAALVTCTDGYTFLDAWHYDTASNIDLGRQFAEAVVPLEK